MGNHERKVSIQVLSQAVQSASQNLNILLNEANYLSCNAHNTSAAVNP